jgi:hypothetical protein
MIAFDLLLLWTLLHSNFITTLLGIFPHKIGEKTFSHWDWGRYLAQKNTVGILTLFFELLSNLYYSPIKKLENIFIFKIAMQQRP